MPKSTSESRILTIKEVAEYLKITERTIYRLAAAKKMPAFKVGSALASCLVRDDDPKARYV